MVFLQYISEYQEYKASSSNSTSLQMYSLFTLFTRNNTLYININSHCNISMKRIVACILYTLYARLILSKSLINYFYKIFTVDILDQSLQNA